MSETRFCNECGAKVKPELSFCAQCGSPLPKDSQSNAEESLKRTKERKPIPKFVKIVIPLVAALLLILAGTHIFMLKQTNEDKKLSRIHNAIVSEDPKQLFSELHTPQGVIYNQESYVKSLKSSVSENFYENMKDAAKRTKETGLTEVLIDNDGVEVFRVKRNQKLLFYPEVIIEPITHRITLQSDLTDTIFKIANEEFELEGRPVIVSEVLPDAYTVKLESSNSLLPSEESQTIERWEFAEDVQLSLDRADYFVAFDEVDSEDMLVVNGKSTQTSLAEVNEFGPIFGGSTVQFSAVRRAEDGSEIESEPVEGWAGTVLSFDYPTSISTAEQADADQASKAQVESKDEKQEADEDHSQKISQASETYRNFRRDYEHALNYKDAEAIQPYLNLDSRAYRELEEFIGDIGDQWYSYDFISNDVIDSVMNKNGTITLTVRETFNFENHLKETVFYDRNKQYLMAPSDSSWLIQSIDIKETERSK